MRQLLALAIVAVSVLLAIAMTMARPEPPKKEREELAPLVNVLELESMDTQFEIRSQGTVRPKTETVLSAEVSGSIVEISPKFVAGGVFQADEVLLKIDPTNYLVAVEQAEALVAQRQIEYDGSQRLLEQGYRAEAEYASAAAALASAKAELVRANRNLQRTSIRLPYEGMVRAKETDLGQFVSPGSRLGIVFSTAVAEIRLPLTDLDLAYVELPNATDLTQTGRANGPKAMISTVQKGKRVAWEAQIVRTEGIVDENSRVTYAVAEITDPYQLHGNEAALPIGTFVSAAIDGSRADGILRIPRTLVRGSNQVVFLDAENRLELREVGIVRSDADYVYVRDGASDGDRVVTTVIETPINGLQVRTTSSGVGE